MAELTNLQEIEQQANQLRIAMQSSQTKLEERQKAANLRNWNRQINDPSLRGIASWVKSKAVATSGDTRASLPAEVSSLIHQYWCYEWSNRALNIENLVGRWAFSH